MKKRDFVFTRKIPATLLALIMVFLVLSPVIHIALAVPETISTLITTPSTNEAELEGGHEIEDDDVPLALGLNNTNGSWSVWLLIPIVLTASLAGLIGVRMLVSKKSTREDN